MKHLIVIASLLAAAATAANPSFIITKPATLLRPERYDHQLLVRVPKTKELFALVDELNLDVWSAGATTVQVRVDARQKRQLERRLRVKAAVLDSNIQRRIDQETQQLNRQLKHPKRFTVGDEDWHKQYHAFDDILQFYKGLAAKYPQLIKWTDSIGKTPEGRDIPLFELTGTAQGDRKNIWFQSQQHAREWIGGANMQYFVDKVTAGYGSDQRITDLLNKVKFVIAPVVNPDGYVYTWTTNRLWRKSRRLITEAVAQNGTTNGTAPVYGVDLNRNWPEHWDEKGGASTNPVSYTYKGPAPASEPEVQALMAAYQSYPDGMVGAIDFHSYSELILRPYGWTTGNSPDEAAFVELGDSLKKIIHEPRGTNYTSEHSIDLYKTTGTASEWYYGNSTTPTAKYRSYGITIELSPNEDDEQYGFELPPEFILPVGREVFPAILAYAEFCVSKPILVKPAN